jgi:hypothetical protein
MWKKFKDIKPENGRLCVFINYVRNEKQLCIGEFNDTVVISKCSGRPLGNPILWKYIELPNDNLINSAIN